MGVVKDGYFLPWGAGSIKKKVCKKKKKSYAVWNLKFNNFSSNSNAWSLRMSYQLCKHIIEWHLHKRQCNLKKMI